MGKCYCHGQGEAETQKHLLGLLLHLCSCDLVFLPHFDVTNVRGFSQDSVVRYGIIFGDDGGVGWWTHLQVGRTYIGGVKVQGLGWARAVREDGPTMWGSGCIAVQGLEVKGTWGLAVVSARSF